MDFYELIIFELSEFYSYTSWDLAFVVKLLVF